MSEKASDHDPDRTETGLAQYVYWGAGLGLAGGLGTLFVLSVHYARALGLSPSECAVVGCTVTVLLSHPAGLLGLAVGSACGALCGAVGHYLRRRLRAS